MENNGGKRKFTKKNCAPTVKNKTVNQRSCFTPQILMNLRDLYNKRYPDDPIKSSNANTIWKELNKRLYTCTNEDCWLSELSEPHIRKKIHDIAFSPKSPSSWKKNPNEWLTNFDINNVLEQYEEADQTFEFIGPSFIDFDAKDGNSCVDPEVCNFNLKHYLDEGVEKVGFIFNLDKHNQSGSHWVSFFVNITDQFVFYFDSVGTSIPKEIKALSDKIIEQGKAMNMDFEYHDNKGVAHQYGNNECGMYSLFFIITLLTNKVNDKPFKDVKSLIGFFKDKRKKRIRDQEVHALRKVYYN